MAGIVPHQANDWTKVFNWMTRPTENGKSNELVDFINSGNRLSISAEAKRDDRSHRYSRVLSLVRGAVDALNEILTKDNITTTQKKVLVARLFGTARKLDRSNIRDWNDAPQNEFSYFVAAAISNDTQTLGSMGVGNDLMEEGGLDIKSAADAWFDTIGKWRSEMGIVDQPDDHPEANALFREIMASRRKRYAKRTQASAQTQPAASNDTTPKDPPELRQNSWTVLFNWISQPAGEGTNIEEFVNSGNRLSVSKMAWKQAWGNAWKNDQPQPNQEPQFPQLLRTISSVEAAMNALNEILVKDNITTPQKNVLIGRLFGTMRVPDETTPVDWNDDGQNEFSYFITAAMSNDEKALSTLVKPKTSPFGKVVGYDIPVLEDDGKQIKKGLDTWFETIGKWRSEMGINQQPDDHPEANALFRDIMADRRRRYEESRRVNANLTPEGRQHNVD